MIQSNVRRDYFIFKSRDILNANLAQQEFAEQIPSPVMCSGAHTFKYLLFGLSYKSTLNVLL